MLNEMIYGGYLCPVCGRYHYRIPLDGWWCEYCKTPYQEDMERLNSKLAAIEK